MGESAVIECMSVLTLRYATEPDSLTVVRERIRCENTRLIWIHRVLRFCEKMEKVRIKGRKCLFAVLRSPGSDMRWGNIPAE